MNILIAGGAGFIGSHFTNYFLTQTEAHVSIYDNFTSGQEWHLAKHLQSPRLTIVKGDLQDLPAITNAMKGQDAVYHFASNPDIAKAMTQPDIDFWQGTYLTQNLLEAMRVNQVRRLIYASGSGVYGDTGETPVHEDYAPLLPISTYGASKLACEALISSYCHMFELKANVFRFANVVGPRQTHGVAYDFIRKLRHDPTQLAILGDGTQSKSYIHVDDIIQGIQHVVSRFPETPYTYYNLATGDYIDVNGIAQIVADCMGLADVKRVYTGGSRGWKGDVPVVRFNLDKVFATGWRPRYNTANAVRSSVLSMLQE